MIIFSTIFKIVSAIINFDNIPLKAKKTKLIIKEAIVYNMMKKTN